MVIPNINLRYLHNPVLFDRPEIGKVKFDITVETGQDEDGAPPQLHEDATEMFSMDTSTKRERKTKEKSAAKQKADEENYRSPMDSTPLRDLPEAQWVEGEDEDLSGLHTSGSPKKGSH